MAQKEITWHELQEALRCATREDTVQALIKAEKKGPNRARWLMRMQGRLNVLRRAREVKELVG